MLKAVCFFRELASALSNGAKVLRYSHMLSQVDSEGAWSCKIFRTSQASVIFIKIYPPSIPTLPSVLRSITIIISFVVVL